MLLFFVYLDSRMVEKNDEFRSTLYRCGSKTLASYMWYNTGTQDQKGF
jgi:hypothetical protein